MSRLALLEEGAAKFLAPDPQIYRDPTKAPVFYNRLMERNRTISVAVLSAYAERRGGDLDVCEPLSAAGIRGIRYALETKAVGKLILNDISKIAYELIIKNLEINGIKADVYNDDANILLRRLEKKCDVVDVDPFGSPAPYLESAFVALRDGGLLCVTATDTAVLVGRYRDKALRRYGIFLRKLPFYVEVGLRALLGYIARVAAASDFAVRPLIAYWERHYFRSCVEVVEGARDAADSLRNLGYLLHSRGYRRTSKYAAEGAVGPLWLSELGDAEFLSSAASGAPGDVAGFFELLSAEYAVERPWYYLYHEFGDLELSLEEVIRALRGRGVYAAPTHMSPQGLKAEADYGELRLLLRSR